MCFTGQKSSYLTLILLCASAFISIRNFGLVLSPNQLQKLASDLAEAHRADDVVAPTEALVTPFVVALRAEHRKSPLRTPFALVFRDEVEPANWRSLATRLRMQRGQQRN